MQKTKSHILNMCAVTLHRAKVTKTIRRQTHPELLFPDCLFSNF